MVLSSTLDRMQKVIQQFESVNAVQILIHRNILCALTTALRVNCARTYIAILLVFLYGVFHELDDHWIKHALSEHCFYFFFSTISILKLKNQAHFKIKVSDDDIIPGTLRMSMRFYHSTLQPCLWQRYQLHFADSLPYEVRSYHRDPIIINNMQISRY